MGMNEAYVHALSTVRGLGPGRIMRIIRAFPDWSSLEGAEELELQRAACGALPTEELLKIRGRLDQLIALAREELELFHGQGIVAIAVTSPAYPPLLRAILDPPPILYCRGNVSILSGVDCLAIVGTREATSRGLEVARRIAKHFVGRGYTIVSGLAKGIDSAAHVGALEARGTTVAVLGTSVDKVYPAENVPLAERILSGGGVLVSEHAPGRKTGRASFVQRNRLQSGMSLAVIPVQTDIKGGTMHTVRFALAQGRLVLCPRPVHLEEGLPQYRGVRHLIEVEKARSFEKKDYELVHQEIQKYKELLLAPDSGSQPRDDQR